MHYFSSAGSTEHCMRSIGVFCSDNNLFCVERATGKPVKMFFTEGSDEGNVRRQGPAAISVTPEVLARFFRQFQQENFKANQINLALPSRDIIFRSFVIPWMPAHEIKNVVDYEIDKYLPFDKSELKFFFHDIKFVHDNIRKIRIVFIGIKKLSLSQYIERFKQIGLEVKLAEPADISLIQTLAFFGEISAGETITLVKKHKDRGKLMIIDQGIPLFVREFSFALADGDPGAAMGRLVNEVRISLDYFIRQDQQFTCKKILFLSSAPEPAISAALQETLGMPVKAIEAGRLFPGQPIDNIEYLNAFGIGLKNTFGLSLDFNSLADEDKNKDGSAGLGDGKKHEIFSITAMVVVSLVLIVTGLFLPGSLTKNYAAQLQEVESRMPDISRKATSDLESEYRMLKDKMDKLKNTRISSEAAYFLKSIPELLPEGVWLRDFDLIYTGDSTNAAESAKGRIEITFQGHSYAGDARTQFQQVDAFLSRLKNDKKFAEYFTSVDLNSMNASQLNSYQVTDFKITCR